ncbi:osmoprotectant NAGGN system M42 family peptidase [Phyllobacterium phragmitis]|uniref:Osmoprotectant NAGGN system M42 family peptidase n=1 Tax=Phyllobacterium phragmitis TaxID=2670329 RepID=A0A2S9IQZ4_9HYPH|nr:osmoprotectant NAGGN system M42 family peptidase [Phyllobacterium phragmitis]PRD42947.1 osmoprotectant NAGGN system M42 family peptidase [Phyllobacterium phragmitis]
MSKLNIDADYLLGQLRTILSIDSPTGYTDNAVRYCSRELERLGLKPELTRRGAIRAVSQGGRREGARAIVSHIDTLGAQVKAIKSNGRLELVPIGHWSARFAEGARVTIYGYEKILRGTILPLKASGHTFNEEVDTQPTGWGFVELRIDAPTTSAEETVALGIDIGDIVAVDPQSEFLDNGFINSRHLDDKAGVAIMLATIEAFERSGAVAPVDVHWLFTIAEEVGVGASSVIRPDVASLVAVDNGTTAPGQNSSEFGVTICMADQSGPFDYHLTRQLTELCQKNGIKYRKDIFRYYRSDSASALEAGHDIRTALVTFGIDASHGYERIHLDALRSVGELLTHYVTSPIEIARDTEEFSDVQSFPRQPVPKTKSKI